MEIKRTINNINNFFNESVYTIFEANIPKVQELLLESYDELEDYVTNDYSRSNPALFREVFEDSLESFEYIEKRAKGYSFIVPTKETFNFRDQELLQQIVEGTMGTYVEISAADLNTLNSSPPAVPINPQDPYPEQVFLIEYTDTVKIQEREILKKNLIEFPFSNIPQGIDIFERADDYVTDNMPKWIKTIIKNGAKEIKSKYRRI